MTTLGAGVGFLERPRAPKIKDSFEQLLSRLSHREKLVQELQSGSIETHEGTIAEIVASGNLDEFVSIAQHRTEFVKATVPKVLQQERCSDSVLHLLAEVASNSEGIDGILEHLAGECNGDDHGDNYEELDEEQDTNDGSGICDHDVTVFLDKVLGNLEKSEGELSGANVRFHAARIVLALAARYRLWSLFFSVPNFQSRLIAILNEVFEDEQRDVAFFRVITRVILRFYGCRNGISNLIASPISEHCVESIALVLSKTCFTRTADPVVTSNLSHVIAEVSASSEGRSLLVELRNSERMQRFPNVAATFRMLLSPMNIFDTSADGFSEFNLHVQAVIQSACWALSHLAQDEETRLQLRNAKTAHMLFDLLHEDNKRTRRMAAYAMAAIDTQGNFIRHVFCSKACVACSSKWNQLPAASECDSCGSSEGSVHAYNEKDELTPKIHLHDAGEDEAVSTKKNGEEDSHHDITIHLAAAAADLNLQNPASSLEIEEPNALPEDPVPPPVPSRHRAALMQSLSTRYVHSHHHSSTEAFGEIVMYGSVARYICIPTYGLECQKLQDTLNAANPLNQNQPHLQSVATLSSLDEARPQLEISEIERQLQRLMLRQNDMAFYTRALLEEVWGLEQAGLIISVVGANGALNLPELLAREIMTGLMQIAVTTKAWIFTAGVGSGVSKLVGEAKARSGSITTPVIGIVNWSQVQHSERLKQQGDIPIAYVASSSNSENNKIPLDGNHTHFILMNDGRDTVSSRVQVSETLLRASLSHSLATSREYRRANRRNALDLWDDDDYDLSDTKFAEDAYLPPPEGNQGSVPLVLVVVGGGRAALDAVLVAAHRGSPIVLIAGAGNASSILTTAYMHFNTQGSGDEKIPSDMCRCGTHRQNCGVMWQEFEYWNEKGQLMRRWCEDDLQTILEIIDTKAQFFPFQLHGNEKAEGVALSEHMGTAILNAVTDAKQKLCMSVLLNSSCELHEMAAPIPDEHLAEALNDVLMLALQLNRPQFVEQALRIGASVSIFDVTASTQRGKSESVARTSRFVVKMMTAADRMELLYAVADRNASLQYLKELFEHHAKQVPDNEDSNNSPLRCQSRIYRAEVRDSVISWLMGDGYKHHSVHGPDDELGIFGELMVWAALTNRIGMTQMLWGKCNMALRASLLLSHLYRELGKTWCVPQELKKEMRESAEVFEGVTKSMLDGCFSRSNEATLDLLTLPSNKWRNRSNLDIIFQSKCEHVVLHQSVRDALDKKWYKGVAPYTLQPVWNAIVMLLAILCPYPFAFLYGVDEKLREEAATAIDSMHFCRIFPVIAAMAMKLKVPHLIVFYSSTVVQFWSHAISHSVLLVLLTDITTSPTRDLPSYTSSGIGNVFLLLWILALIFEEAKEMFYFETPVKLPHSITRISSFQDILKPTVLQSPISPPSPSSPASASSGPSFGTSPSKKAGGIDRGLSLAVNHQYWKKKWSAPDCVMLLAFVIGTLFRTLWVNYDNNIEALDFFARMFLSLSLFLFHIRLFAFFSASKSIGPLLVTLLSMIYDVGTWLVMFLVMIAAFGFAMQVSAIEPFEGSGYRWAVNPSLWSNTEYLTELTHTYWVMFANFEYTGVTSSSTLRFCILIVYCLFINVIMLNLLIAMMSSTISVHSQKAHISWVYLRYHTILDHTTRPTLPAPLTLLSDVLNLFYLVASAFPRPTFTHAGHSHQTIVSTNQHEMSWGRDSGLVTDQQGLTEKMAEQLYDHMDRDGNEKLSPAHLQSIIAASTRNRHLRDDLTRLLALFSGMKVIPKREFLLGVSTSAIEKEVLLEAERIVRDINSKHDAAEGHRQRLLVLESASREQFLRDANKYYFTDELVGLRSGQKGGGDYSHRHKEHSHSWDYPQRRSYSSPVSIGSVPQQSRRASSVAVPKFLVLPPSLIGDCSPKSPDASPALGLSRRSSSSSRRSSSVISRPRGFVSASKPVSMKGKLEALADSVEALVAASKESSNENVVVLSGSIRETLEALISQSE